MRRYRVGASHGVTIIEYDPAEQADEQGRRLSDRLIATAQTGPDARRIADAMNRAAA